MPPVQVDASRTNRSLSAAAAGPSKRPQLVVDLPLLFWRRLVDTAVAEAKKTRHGWPTDNALQQRWWLQQHRPKQSDKDEWEISFESACHFLGIDDVEAERKRLLAEIDDEITRDVMKHVSDVSYRRMAAVMTCAGIPKVHTRLLPSGRTAKQYVLGLVSLEDYEDVAGVDHPDPPARKSCRAEAQPPVAIPATPATNLIDGRPRPPRRGSSPKVGRCG